MPENEYCNYLSHSKRTSADKDKRHCSEQIQRQFSVLLFLSLLANGGLAYLYYTNNANNQHCESRKNCLNSGSRFDSQPTMKNNSMNIKNHSLPNCSDFKEKWVQGKGRFYVFSTDTMDWDSSRKRCQDLGGDLVIVNNEDQQKFLSERVNDIYDFYWIGLTDSQTEGEWLWVDNTPLNNILLWELPPDDWKVENPLHGEDCVILKGEKWGDVSCIRKQKRICEIPCSPQ